MERSEKFCQDKALYNAITNSIGIFDETKKSNYTKDAIPTILSDALSVSFDTHIHHQLYLYGQVSIDGLLHEEENRKLGLYKYL